MSAGMVLKSTIQQSSNVDVLAVDVFTDTSVIEINDLIDGCGQVADLQETSIDKVQQ